MTSSQQGDKTRDPSLARSGSHLVLAAISSNGKSMSTETLYREVRAGISPGYRKSAVEKTSVQCDDHAPGPAQAPHSPMGQPQLGHTCRNATGCRRPSGRRVSYVAAVRKKVWSGPRWCGQSTPQKEYSSQMFRNIDEFHSPHESSGVPKRDGQWGGRSPHDAFVLNVKSAR